MIALAALAISSLTARYAFAEDLGVGLNTSVNTAINGQLGSRMRNNGNSMMNNGNRVVGTVTAVNGTTLTVTDRQSGAVYTVITTDAKLDKNKSVITVSGIAVGDTIFAEGSKSGTTLTAKVVHDGALMVKEGPGFKGRGGISGTVTAVSGTTITVSSKGGAAAVTYTVDAANATVQKDNATSVISAIAVGDQVRIQGTVSGTTVTATNIMDGKLGGGVMPQGNGQPIIVGTVTAVSGNTITITNKSNTSYTIDATSATFIKKGATGTITSIAVGDTVIAQGTINGTSVVAVSVTDQGNISAAGGKAGGVRGFFGSIGSFFKHLFGF